MTSCPSKSGQGKSSQQSSLFSATHHLRFIGSVPVDQMVLLVCSDAVSGLQTFKGQAAGGSWGGVAIYLDLE